MVDSNPINVHSVNEEIELKDQTYRIWILGGHWADIGDFSITLTNMKSGEKFHSRKIRCGIQGYDFGMFSKKISEIKVDYSGHYKIEFINPKSIKVKPINLWPFSQLFAETSNNGLTIFFRGHY